VSGLLRHQKGNKADTTRSFILDDGMCIVPRNALIVATMQLQAAGLQGESGYEKGKLAFVAA
jgi:hypothetical protein